MKKLFAAFIMLGIVLSADAQVSKFLESGKSGVGLKAMNTIGNDFTGGGAALMATFKGKLDLDLGYYHSIYDGESASLITSEATGNDITADLTWWALRKQISPMVDAGFGVMAGFSTSSFKDYKYIHYTDGNTVEYNSWVQGSLGIDSYIRIKLADTWYMQPSIGIRYELGKDKETEVGVETKTGYLGITSILGLSLAKRFENGGAIFLTTEQYFDSYDEEVYYAVGLGYAFTF